MIICPNCNHHNPDGSSQCENCYTPLPQTTSCPNCGASVQTDATFCGQCGFNLQVEMVESVMNIAENIEAYPELTYTEEKELLVSLPTSEVSSEDLSSPLQSPWDEEENRPKTTGSEAMPWEQEVTKDDHSETTGEETRSWEQEVAEEKEPETAEFANGNHWEIEELPELSESEDLSSIVNSIENLADTNSKETESAAEVSTPTPASPEEKPDLANQKDAELPLSISIPEPEDTALQPQPSNLEPEDIVLQPQPSNATMTGLSSATQLQLQNARLLQVQANKIIEIPPNLSVVHIGKPNSQIPPDIDVSGFPDSEVVSRIHADIRIEGDAYFIEDVGSSNGTYINYSPLLVGNRYRLRSGDRISLGKGDLVTFIFQLSE